LIVHWTIERRLRPSPVEMTCVRGQLRTKFHLIITKPKLRGPCRQSYNCGNKIPMINNYNEKLYYFT